MRTIVDQIRHFESRMNPSLSNRVTETLTKFLLEGEGKSSATISNVEILYIGCGQGLYWNAILGNLPKGTLVDLTLFDVNIANINPDLISPKNLNSLEVIQGDVLQLNHTWKTFDSIKIVTCFEVLEHLPKHNGWQLLYLIDKILSVEKNCLAILSTPRGFVYQGPSIDNSHNAHLSEWSERDFRAAGYFKVIGLTRSSVRALESNNLRTGGVALRFFKFLLSALLCRMHPNLAFELLATKKVFAQQTTFSGN